MGNTVGGQNIDLNAEFAAMDTTNSGKVTKNMMLNYVSKKGIKQYSPDQLIEYFELLDKNNNGFLDKTEFQALFEVLQSNADDSEAHLNFTDSKDLKADMLEHHKPSLTKGSVADAFLVEESADNSKFYMDFEFDFDRATSAQKEQQTMVLYPDHVTGSFGFGVTARDSGKLIVNSINPNAAKYGLELYDVITGINGGAIGKGEGLMDPEMACTMLKDLKQNAKPNETPYITLTWVTLNRDALECDTRKSTEAVVDTYIGSQTSLGPTIADDVQLEIEVKQYVNDMDEEKGGSKLGMNLSFNSNGEAGDFFAVVTTVEPGSMGHEAGFRVHDIIKAVGSVDGKTIGSVGQFNAAIKQAFAESDNTHIIVTVARLRGDQFVALKNRSTHNPSFFFLSQATMLVILFKMLLFIPFLYAAVLLFTYGSTNTYTTIVTGAALIFLIEVDKVFYDKLVSGSEKTAMVKDLNAAVEEDDKLREEFEQVNKMSKISSLYAQKTQPHVSEKELTQFGKAIEAGSRSALNTIKTETNATGSISRLKRISVHFPDEMSFGCFTPCSARDVLSFEHTDQFKLCCVRETTKAVKQQAPENIFTYAAWKVTEGQISWPLFIKVLACAVLQWGAVMEIITQYEYVLEDGTCDGDNVIKGFTLMLVILAVYFCGMNDVYESMISVNLIAWPEHYKDFDGAFSACYEMIFPSKWALCCNGCVCVKGGAWTYIINVIVTWSALFSSALMSPLVVCLMFAAVYKAAQACDN
jgi:C-terminal processing protease CtpA/Prc